MKRVTTRALTGVVAAVAIGLAGERMWRRSAELTRMAKGHEMKRDHCILARNGWLLTQIQDRKKGLAALSAAHHFDQLAGHEARLGRKYRRAARFPWLRAAPDPPPPPGPFQ